MLRPNSVWKVSAAGEQQLREWNANSVRNMTTDTLNKLLGEQMTTAQILRLIPGSRPAFIRELERQDLICDLGDFIKSVETINPQNSGDFVLRPVHRELFYGSTLGDSYPVVLPDDTGGLSDSDLQTRYRLWEIVHKPLPGSMIGGTPQRKELK